jgi:hypothetical protein
MATVLANEFTEILTHRESPCVSLYMPTYRSPPNKAQNTIRFRQLLQQLHTTLSERFGVREAETLLEPLTNLAADSGFWGPVFEGVVFLASPGFFRTFKTHRPLPERAVVADSFHVKPLIRILQSADRYQILGISRTDARIFEGNRDTLDELPSGDGVPRTYQEAMSTVFNVPMPPPRVAPEPAAGSGESAMNVVPHSEIRIVEPDVERFFRVVDRAVLEHYSRPSGLPLILTALSEHHAAFRSVSENPFLLDEMIPLNVHAVDTGRLRQLAWTILEPRYLARLAGFCDEFHEKKSKQLADDDLFGLAEAAVMSRIRTLLIDANKRQPGRIDENTGNVERGVGETTPYDDVFDDLAELVLARGGEVIIVPSDRMPTLTGAAGIYRF